MPYDLPMEAAEAAEANKPTANAKIIFFIVVLPNVVLNQTVKTEFQKKTEMFTGDK